MPRLRNLFRKSRPSGRAPARGSSFRPEVTALEDRLVLSASHPAAITYEGYLHAFTTSSDGHLYDHYLDGANVWHSDDHGNGGSTGSTLSGSPAAITYEGRLHVFVTGLNGHLYDHWWDGGNWHFDDHGNAGTIPTGGTAGRAAAGGGVGTLSGSASLNGSPDTVIDAAGRLHVFVTDSNGHLVDHWWDDASGWHWKDRGNGGSPLYGTPSAIVYSGGYLHVLATGANGHLYDDVSADGLNFTWGDRSGDRGGNFSVGSDPSAVLYSGGYLHIFVTGTDGRLYDDVWSGSWNWNPFGNGGSPVYGAPAALTDPAGRLHVFATGANGRLYDYMWSGGWGWVYHGYAVTDVGGDPGAVVYGGQPHAFVMGTNNRLYDQAFDGKSSWPWRDAGGNVPSDDLQLKYNSLGGTLSIPGTLFLGSPTSGEMPTPYGGGRYETFQYGTIYWSAATSAHEVHGDILTEYNATAGETDYYGRVVLSQLGLPTSDEMDVPGVKGARMNTFQGGDIYWSKPTGAHFVDSAIRDKYNSAGGPTGLLGLPTTDESPTTGGRVCNFEHGQIKWTPPSGAVVTQLGPFTVNLVEVGDGSVSGWAQLTLYADGSYNFVGHCFNYRALGADDSVAFGIKSASGVVFTFAHTGHMAGWLEFGSSADDWSVSGQKNSALANAWDDIVAGGQFRSGYSLTASMASVFADLVSGFGAAKAVYQLVTA
jgi:hypothetical protein